HVLVARAVLQCGQPEHDADQVLTGMVVQVAADPPALLRCRQRPDRSLAAFGMGTSHRGPEVTCRWIGGDWMRPAGGIPCPRRSHPAVPAGRIMLCEGTLGRGPRRVGFGPVPVPLVFAARLTRNRIVDLPLVASAFVGKPLHNAPQPTTDGPPQPTAEIQ